MRDWRTILIDPSDTIFKAIEIIDKGALQIALVVDQHQKLLGTVTDGDIRRGILKGISLHSAVAEIMNPQPILAKVTDGDKYILSILKKDRIHHIPVVDENGILRNVKFLDHLVGVKTHDNWVIIMAGGLGTRLKPLTDHTPKPLLKVGSKPILETILENFIDQGFHRFYLSVNYKAEMITEYFGDGSRWGVEIRYLYEDKKLGTAGALSLLMDILDNPIIVMNGDILTKINFQQLIDFHNKMNGQATMCVREFSYQIPYGVVKINNHQLLTIEEKPTHNYFVSAGIYVLNPNVLSFIPKKQFYDMPSLFDKLINRGFETLVFPIREYWLDIGRLDDFKRANEEYNEVF
ncbi:nucleotidyltransferase family protein [Tepidibacillus marianensis]|uniref:nucleotidyltransferase family protein n=1 Tax=Tepidibacillus marianensis TaxID=3131995 RepID=UPI0030D4833C